MSDQPDVQRLTISQSEAAKLRTQAGELLARLIENRQLSERRAAETGKRDPMKSITGHTALENAIASTRDMIAQLEALLASAESTQLESVGAIASNGSHWTAHRPSIRSNNRSSVRAAALTAAP